VRLGIAAGGFYDTIDFNDGRRGTTVAIVLSTKMTKGGQTTVPREIRAGLGIGPESRVYWTFDGTRAILTAEPILPNEVASEDDFWDGIELAMRDVRAGKLQDARDLSANIRGRLGLE
jgi:bifunctional DNA-binding transcriptional regulator/antitoxin component of YhaV-PrlF toxin-antitoxin module